MKEYFSVAEQPGLEREKEIIRVVKLSQLPVGLVRVDAARDFIKDGSSSTVGDVADAIPAVHVLTAGDLGRHREVAISSGAKLGALWLLQLRPGGAVHLGEVVALRLGQGEGEPIRAERDGLDPGRRAVKVSVALLRVPQLVCHRPLLALELLQALLGSTDSLYASRADVEGVLNDLDPRRPWHGLCCLRDFLGRNQLLGQDGISWLAGWKN